ncbi:MAG: YhdP family protein [Gammaproteobacteria bacterium]
MLSRFKRFADWTTRHRRLGRWSLGVLVAVSVLVVIAVGLFMLAAEILPHYQDQIVKQVSSKLDAPIALGKVSLGWHGWGPELDFHELSVRSPKTGEVVLSAKRLRLDFTLAALIHGTRARPYAIALDRPHVTLVQTRKGGFQVPGLHFNVGGSGVGMLGAGIVVHDGTLKLHFADPQRQSWTFTSLNLDIGSGKTHAVRLQVGLPAALGGNTLRVAGSVTTPKLKLQTWQWQGKIALDRLPLASIAPYLPADWPRPTGTIGFDVTVRGSGTRLAAASGQLKAENFAANGGHLPRFATHFKVTRQGGLRFVLNDDMFEFSNQAWHPGKVVFERAPDGLLHASVQRVTLAALPPLADFLPASQAKLEARVHKMRPTGTIRNLDVALTPGHMDNVSLAARLDDVGVDAAAGAPGFNHLAGSVRLKHGVGIFALDAPGFTMRMPHLFTHTVPLDRVAGNIGIALTENGMRIAMPRLHITGPAGLDGTVMATLTIPHKGHVHARLAAWAASLDANAARPRYIPTGLLPKRLTAWLMHQLHDGRAGPMLLRLAGDVRRFPFQHGGGHFSVVFAVHGVGLAPGKGWAPISNIAGTVRFENAAMHAEMISGEVEGAQVGATQATIPDLFHPQLSVKTEIAGTLPDFIAFLKKSPVAGKLKGVFNKVTTGGAARTQLIIEIPIMHPKRLKLAGTLDLDDATIAYGARPWKIEKLSGGVSYDERGPTGGKLEGNALGTPVHIALAQKKTSQGVKLNVKVAGRVPVATLSKVADTDFSPYATGRIPFDATLVVPLRANPLPLTINVSSDLQGLAIKLPVPAGKSALAKLPFTAQLRVAKGALDINARYADVVSVCTGLDTKAAQLRLQAVDLLLGGGVCKRPKSGIYLRGGWRELDINPWLNVLPKTKSGGNKSSLFSLENLHVDVRFDDIRALGQQFKNQTIRGTFESRQMQFTLGGPDLAGTVTVPRKPTNANPITAVLSRGHFALPHNTVKAKSPASADAASREKLANAEARINRVATGNKKGSGSSLKPQSIPPFELSAKQIALGTALLDDVKIVSRHVPGGIAINPIHVGGGALKFQGQFVWLEPAGGGEQGALHFIANIASLGKLLAGLGIGSVVTGHGALSAGLAWRRPPEGKESVSGLLGKVSTDLRDGSISQVSPGAGRLLSLLSLVNIPRYLVFNFHNLFSKGFPYSRIYGDYDIKNGVAHTKALKIESSIANINLSGEVNLVNETMNQTADVEPNYFGSLPIIGAIVGGLGVGAVVFALTKLFGNPISHALAMKYSIRGPITNPVVKKVGSAPPQQAPAPATAGAQ